MADDIIRKYHDALRKQKAAAQAAYETLSPARDAGEVLKEWWKAVVGDERLDNKSGSHLRPSTLNSQRWPSFEQITKAITEWKKATAEVAMAWDQLDSNDKEFESPPPKEPQDDCR